MNFLEKQLVLNSGRTMWEESKIPRPGSALDYSGRNIGPPSPPPQRVSVQKWEWAMREIRRASGVPPETGESCEAPAPAGRNESGSKQEREGM